MNAQIFKDTIARFVKEGKLVIFSSHQMSYVEEVCDDICLIHEGRILLTGDLHHIKLQMGENKLLLRLDGQGDDQLEAMLLAEFPALHIRRHEEGLILDTGSQISQGDILRFIARERLSILRFGLYTPSLNDIFIQKAGERS